MSTASTTHAMATQTAAAHSEASLAPGAPSPTSRDYSAHLLQSHDERLVIAAEVGLLERAFDQARQRTGTPSGPSPSIATVVPAAARTVFAKAGPPVDEETKRRQQAAAERAERAERVQACLVRANVLGKY